MAETSAPRIGRIPIRHLAPASPEGRWSPKAFAGEVVPFRATVFREGHDELGVRLLLTAPDGAQRTIPMRSIAKGTDRWLAEVRLDQVGDWRWTVRGYSDEWATWLHTAAIKLGADLDVDLVLAMGEQLLSSRKGKPYRDALKVLRDVALPPLERLHRVASGAAAEAIADEPLATLVTDSAEQTLRVERARAGLGSWYEFFPRSEGARRLRDGSWKSGTFRTAAKRLPAVAAMGFDVLYMPPIHPIGTSHRKGPNNTLTPAPGDPGSPWAIGGPEGGHDAIHPDLGQLKDFRSFVKQAQANGIEVALDLALQASPDHPWVTSHPEWFTTRPDGSIAYAENPPKKYQDIYPINFDNDPEGIRAEVLRIVEHWIAQGVRIFRVDNPHTKPLDFWEWLLGVIHERHPDVVFLAEAFTRPPMLQSLAQAGFQQSYTYFTWRNTKEELEEYLTELSRETSDFLRPNLFVNTPDILTEYLQFGGPAAYRIRAAIAATGSPTWGVYAGYELIENVARPGAEENIDNEKFEYKERDWAGAEERGESLAPYLARLNAIRREHPALQQLRNLTVHWSDDDAVLVYTKHLAAEHSPTGAADTVIVVANVDPHSVRETEVHLDLEALGLPERFTVTDLLTGDVWTWGEHNYVRLDAFHNPVHLLSVSPLDKEDA